MIGSVAQELQGRGVHVTPLAHVVRTQILNKQIFFTVLNHRDTIQKRHLEGAFYEAEELAIIARHFPLGGAFLDIGANVGNHSIYVAKFLHACRVVCIEPNPPSIQLLESNIALNCLDDVVDLQYLGVGLSDHTVDGAKMHVPPRNLGGSRFVPGEGELKLKRADELLAGHRFDLVKIDVEGMELEVLSGMKGLMQDHRPKMFVEVDNENVSGFKAWLKDAGYRSIERFKRYRANINHLIGPIE